MKPYFFPNVNAEKQIRVDSPNRKTPFFQPIGFDKKGNLTINLQNNMIYDDDTPSNRKDKIKESEINAYDNGYKKGEKHGLQAVRDRIDSMLSSLREAVIELDKLKKKILLSAEREAVELSFAVAKKIVCHEVSVNRDVVANVVKEALKKAVDYKKIKIRLSPSDMGIIKEAKKIMPEFEENPKAFLLEEDENIMPGGCIIETDLGDIDARIDKQLQIVDEAFKSEIDKLGR